MRKEYINPKSLGCIYLADKPFEIFDVDGQIHFLLNDLRKHFSTSPVNSMIPEGTKIPAKLHFPDSKFPQRYMLVSGHGVCAVLSRIRDKRYLADFIKATSVTRRESEDLSECDV